MNALPEDLGHGVFASFDPEHNTIWLLSERNENSLSKRPVVRVDRVALNTTTFSALMRFADKVWPEPTDPGDWSP
jgi:hypothetical protein